MYPFIRMIWNMTKTRNAPAIDVLEEHRSQHYCLPWDIDLWRELNNGRTLTLYDLGRLPMARRIGMMDLLKSQRWGMTVAGVSVRYRRRIRMFEKIEMRSRVLGWDARFIYIEQSIWKEDGECANHILLRMATTNEQGIVPPAEMLAALKSDRESPRLPDWTQAWIDADAQRPWPPMQA